MPHQLTEQHPTADFRLNHRTVPDRTKRKIKAIFLTKPEASFFYNRLDFGNNKPTRRQHLKV
jgi:hypothetical protein